MAEKTIIEKFLTVGTVVGFVALVMVFIWLANDPDTPANKMKAEIANTKAECYVIGDMRDYSKSQGHFMRMIYKCPDGQIRIR